ncbi:MAG TPA: Rrf2 family transcriptional regulator [Tepidisphaeraceae bacterium]|nr:Rrf2 family transcriptional regulator [Tepidisphaeraceae bacterium]
MQLSQTAEYALRAVVWLAEHPGDPQTTQQIADGCKVPVSYLSKVFQPLSKVGMVSAQRGLGGGYVLERDVDQISLLDVVNAVEQVQRIRSCPLKLASHGSKLCALHQSLDNAMAEVEQRFGQIMIGQLLRNSTGVRPLCETTGLAQLGISARAGGSPGQAP